MSKKQKNAAVRQTVWLLPLIKVGLYACLFMPLIVGSNYIFPFIFPKQAFFQLVVEIVFGLYLFLALREPKYRPRTSWLFKVMLAYFLILVLSSVFGVNTYHSFWSNYERMAGVIALFHYFGFLMVLANVLKTKEEWFRFFDFSISASVLEALWGLGQILGIGFFLHYGSGGRVDGSIGNAAFFAGYMLINALFAFWLLLEKKEFGWKIFYAATILLNIFMMFRSQTRGAMIALAAGLVAIGLFFIFGSKKGLSQLPIKKPERLRKYGVGLLVVLFLAIVLIWANKDSSFVKSQPTLDRITHISLSDGTSQTRLMAWKMSLRGFKDRPIFGWGPENYNIVFNKYYDPYLYPTESWFDRSHNAYLDVLVNTGAVGFAAYAGIFLFSFWYLWKRWRQDRIDFQTFAVFCVILLTYGIQNVVLFDTQVTLLMIFAIWAFIAFVSFEKKETENKPIKPNLFFVGLLVLAVAFSAYFFNIKPGAAGQNGIKSLLLFYDNKAFEGVEKFKQTYAMGTFGLPEIATRAQDLALQVINNKSMSQNPQAMQIIDVAIDGLTKTLDSYEPQNARYMMMLGNLYLNAGQKDVNSGVANSAYLQQAEVIIKKALELSPTRQEIYFNLAQLKLFQGRNDEILPYLKTAVELNDKVAVSHWNYGIFAIAVGQDELGSAEIKRSVELGHGYTSGDIQMLINAYGRTTKLDKIKALYEDWIKYNPNDATAYAGLADLYLKMGDKQKAKETALRAAEVNPDYKAEADEFIKNLGL